MGQVSPLVSKLALLRVVRLLAMTKLTRFCCLRLLSRLHLPSHGVVGGPVAPVADAEVEEFPFELALAAIRNVRARLVGPPVGVAFDTLVAYGVYLLFLHLYLRALDG